MGRPIYRDMNGRVKEVRTAKDVDSFTQNLGQNPFAKPRMVEFVNPVTGRKTWEPDRVGGLHPNPVTGEPIEKGQIIRERQQLVPLGRIEGEYVPPSFAPNGMPLKDGILQQVPAEKKSLGIIDPATGKPMTMADCWGGPENGVSVGRVADKRPQPGMKW